MRGQRDRGASPLTFVRKSISQRVIISVILAAIALTVLFSERSAERYGDRLQITLPVLALGCQIVNGQGAEYLLRYGVMFFGVHGSKRALADTPINVRPDGGLLGFPSAHTSTAVFGASSLVNDCITGHPVVKGVVLLTAGFVGASRIESERHDIWQVLAGALIGWAADRAFRRNSPRRRFFARGFLTVRDAIASGFSAVKSYLWTKLGRAT